MNPKQKLQLKIGAILLFLPILIWQVKVMVIDKWDELNPKPLPPPTAEQAAATPPPPPTATTAVAAPTAPPTPAPPLPVAGTPTVTPSPPVPPTFGRDPFSFPPAPLPGEVQTPRILSPSKEQGLVLSAVCMPRDRDPYAVINDTPVSVGDPLPGDVGFVLKSVQELGVLLTKDGKEYFLPLK